MSDEAYKEVKRSDGSNSNRNLGRGGRFEQGARSDGSSSYRPADRERGYLPTGPGSRNDDHRGDRPYSDRGRPADNRSEGLRDAPRGNPRENPRGNQRENPRGNQRENPRETPRGNQRGNQRGNPRENQKGSQKGSSRGNNRGNQRGERSHEDHGGARSSEDRPRDWPRTERAAGAAVGERPRDASNRSERWEQDDRANRLERDDRSNRLERFALPNSLGRPDQSDRMDRSERFRPISGGLRPEGPRSDGGLRPSGPRADAGTARPAGPRAGGPNAGGRPDGNAPRADAARPASKRPPLPPQQFVPEKAKRGRFSTGDPNHRTKAPKAEGKEFSIGNLPKGPKGPGPATVTPTEPPLSFALPKREPLGPKFRPIDKLKPEARHTWDTKPREGVFAEGTRPAVSEGASVVVADEGRATAAVARQYFTTSTTSPIYSIVQQVGEGTYGKVYKASNAITHEIVALKRLRLESEKEGFPITAIREIRLLQSFHHPNVIGLLEMMVEGLSRVLMNFDYMDHDLSGVLNHPTVELSDGHCKFLFKQLMEGLAYLHSKRVIHRDIKASNILLDSIGRLKIADFGLARTMKFVRPGESPDYTNRVITLWYRPPELLLGSTDYGREVDIWGVGCLLVELFNKKAIFPGEDEISQLHRIFDVMGSPTDASWPAVDRMPWYELVKPQKMRPSGFKLRFGFLLSERCFDLALKLLTVNPEHRITAAQALEHMYFKEDPQPEPLHFLKDLEGEWHEFETKKRRKKEREEKMRDGHGDDDRLSAKPESKSLVETSLNALEA